MARWSWMAAVGLAACGKDGDGTGDETPIEEYACTQIAVGDIVDVAATREEAREIDVGRSPWRVNLLPGQAGYVRFSPPGGELTLIADFAGGIPAWWDGEERVAFDPGEPDASCDTDLPEVQRFTPSGGSAWLEVGPAYQGAIWLMLGQ